MFGELQNALDRIWRAPAREKVSGLWRMLRARLLSIGMILGIAFLLMVSLVLDALLQSLGKLWGTGAGRRSRRRSTPWSASASPPRCSP